MLLFDRYIDSGVQTIPWSIKHETNKVV